MLPIWLLLAGVLSAELPKLPPGGAPPLKAFWKVAKLPALMDPDSAEAGG